jgi:predicted PurR-regulated permease PerM
MGRALRWWLLGRFASMGIVFVLTWIGLALLGVPLPFLLALIAGLFSFVPTFGPVASAVPAVLVGLSAGLQQALWVALLYLAVQMVESYGITPLIQRRTVRIPPALLVVFQLIMAVLAGVLGVLLATPILVVLMVLVGMLYVEDRLGEETDLP